MPILQVQVVLREGEVLAPGLARAIANAAASVFTSPPGGTWVRLASLSPANYAEDGGGPPAGVNPVFVSVLKAHLQSAAELSLECTELTRAIAGVVNRPPENVHVTYEPDAAGRVSFGGKLVSG